MSIRCGKWVGLALVAGTVTFGYQPDAFGQVVGRMLDSSQFVREMSLLDFMRQGGWVMYALAAMSVAAVALIIYLSVILRRGQLVPEPLRLDVLSSLERGLTSDARTACSYKPCAFAEVTTSALDYAESAGTPEATQLKDVIEGEGSRQAALLQNQTQYLFDIAVLSPMVGLLGTVFGMIHAFSAVALDVSKAKPMLLADGVAQALVATAAGLIVGIPTMAFYAIFRNRASRLIADLEIASGQLLNVLLRKKT